MNKSELIAKIADKAELTKKDKEYLDKLKTTEDWFYGGFVFL